MKTLAELFEVSHGDHRLTLSMEEGLRGLLVSNVLRYARGTLADSRNIDT